MEEEEEEGEEEEKEEEKEEEEEEGASHNFTVTLKYLPSERQVGERGVNSLGIQAMGRSRDEVR